MGLPEVLAKLRLTIVQNDRISDLSTLHTPSGLEIDMSDTRYGLKRLLDHHETVTPSAPYGLRWCLQLTLFVFQSSGCRHDRPPLPEGSPIPVAQLMFQQGATDWDDQSH